MDTRPPQAIRRNMRRCGSARDGDEAVEKYTRALETTAPRGAECNGVTPAQLPASEPRRPAAATPQRRRSGPDVRSTSSTASSLQRRASQRASVVTITNACALMDVTATSIPASSMNESACVRDHGDGITPPTGSASGPTTSTSGKYPTTVAAAVIRIVRSRGPARSTKPLFRQVSRVTILSDQRR